MEATPGAESAGSGPGQQQRLDQVTFSLARRKYLLGIQRNLSPFRPFFIQIVKYKSKTKTNSCFFFAFPSAEKLNYSLVLLCPCSELWREELEGKHTREREIGG